MCEEGDEWRGRCVEREMCGGEGMCEGGEGDVWMGGRREECVHVEKKEHVMERVSVSIWDE